MRDGAGYPLLFPRNEVDSIPTLDPADSGQIYTSFFKNRPFTNLLGVNEVNDLFLKNEV